MLTASYSMVLMVASVTEIDIKITIQEVSITTSIMIIAFVMANLSLSTGCLIQTAIYF